MAEGETSSDQAPGPHAGYMANYQKLRECVQRMQQMGEAPDVDALLPLTQQGSAAAQECLNRIEQVERALGLKDDEAGEASGSTSAEQGAGDTGAPKPSDSAAPAGTGEEPPPPEDVPPWLDESGGAEAGDEP